MADEAEKKESQSLNELNLPGLLALSGLNLAVFAFLCSFDAKALSTWAQAWALLLPAGIGLAMVRVVNGLLDGQQKNFLVFGRWTNQFPATRAFSVYILRDERIKKIENLAQKLGLTELPSDAAQQESTWYTIYRTVEDLPAVKQAGRNFLFTRDYAAISFIMLLLLGIAACFTMPWTRAPFYWLGLLFQYALAVRATWVYAIELVQNAIVSKATEKPSAG